MRPADQKLGRLTALRIQGLREGMRCLGGTRATDRHEQREHGDGLLGSQVPGLACVAGVPANARPPVALRLIPEQQAELEATGMRVGELERLTWGDVDEPRQRWRVSAAATKTGRARPAGLRCPT